MTLNSLSNLEKKPSYNKLSLLISTDNFEDEMKMNGKNQIKNALVFIAVA